MRYPDMQTLTDDKRKKIGAVFRSVASMAISSAVNLPMRVSEPIPAQAELIGLIMRIATDLAKMVVESYSDDYVLKRVDFKTIDFLKKLLMACDKDLIFGTSVSSAMSLSIQSDISIIATSGTDYWLDSYLPFNPQP